MSAIKSLGIVLLAIAGMAFAQSDPRPSAQKVVLVELFTSEGCSDCPPADAILKRMDGKRTEKGQLIVGISEHVTYWNQQGWVDPFSQEVFTTRQHDYAGRFRLDDVYTPQMVINGEAQMVGGNQAAIVKALANVGQGSEASIALASVSAGNGTVTVDYQISGLTSAADVFAVITEDATNSKVQRGENGGKTLEHVAVARSLTRLGKVENGGQVKTASIKLPARATGATGGRHVIFFVQQPRMGRILAVSSRILPEGAEKTAAAAGPSSRR